MKSKTKIAITVALVLAAIGLVITFADLIAMKFSFNFKEIDMSQYTENTHNITNSFNSISIQVSTADIIFVPSADGKITVVTEDSDKLKHTVDVDENGTLNIKSNDSRKWYDSIVSFSWTSPKITVNIPSSITYSELDVTQTTGSIDIPKAFTFGEIHISKTTGSARCKASCSGELYIHTTTGSITVSDASAQSADIHSTTGSVYVSSVNIESRLLINTTTGSIKLDNTECQSLSASATTGSIKLDGCRASVSAELSASTGSINGNLRGSYNYIATATTGSVHVPESDPTAPLCKLTTTTGSINITRNN